MGIKYQTRISCDQITPAFIHNHKKSLNTTSFISGIMLKFLSRRLETLIKTNNNNYFCAFISILLLKPALLILNCSIIKFIIVLLQYFGYMKLVIDQKLDMFNTFKVDTTPETSHKNGVIHPPITNILKSKFPSLYRNYHLY